MCVCVWCRGSTSCGDDFFLRTHELTREQQSECVKHIPWKSIFKSFYCNMSKETTSCVSYERRPFGSYKQVFLGCVSRRCFGQSGVILKWLEGVFGGFYIKNILEAAICLGGDFLELLSSRSACFWVLSRLGCAVAPLGTIPYHGPKINQNYCQNGPKCTHVGFKNKARRGTQSTFWLHFRSF